MSTQTHSVAENSMEEIRHASPGARIARTGVAPGPTSNELPMGDKAPNQHPT